MTYSIYTTNTSPTFTVGAGGSGGSGTVLTAGSSNWSWGTTGINDSVNIQGKTLHVDGNASITGELTVGNVKLSERLDQIEQRLNILRPNEELEEKWENLRALGQAYRELEKEILEKQEMWAILKK